MTQTAILAAVFLLIAVRQVGGLRLGIWQIMLGGAALALVTGGIAPAEALAAVDWDVMVFLFGMFVVGEAMAESGYLYSLAHGLFGRAGSASGVVARVLLYMGLLSAAVMNDTVAIIGTPLMLHMASRHDVDPKLLLLTLCFAVTIGSAASPIGNPQNLLVAVNGGLDNPFVTFAWYLLVPTAVNLLAAFFVLRRLFPGSFSSFSPLADRAGVGDRRLALLCRVSLYVIAGLVALRVLASFGGYAGGFRLTYIAVGACLPILLFSRRRLSIVRRVDWRTLVFFAAMFVLMASVWSAGLIQRAMAEWEPELLSVDAVMALGIVVSQFLSNVPFVALYLPALKGASEVTLAALAAGSTIAGNLLILGAASNVIVIQNAEKRGVTLGFLEFARAGVPLTVINVLVYRAWFALVA